MPSAGSDDHRGWRLAIIDGCRLLDDEGAMVRVSPLQRSLLARLAVAAPHAVSVEELIDALWPSGAPRTARAALHNQVSRLRSATAERIVRSDGDTYALGIPTDAADALATVRAAEGAMRAGDLEQAFDMADAVLAQRRGPPLDGVGSHPDIDAARRYLAEILVALESIRLEAAVGTGRQRWAIGEAERLLGANPYDERTWMLLTRALIDVGRRGDALGAIDRARHTLRTGLGLPIGAALAELERTVLLDAEPQALSEPSFVGRDDELTRTRELVAAGQNVIVVGDLGAGKSRFLRRLRQQVRRRLVTVVETVCQRNPGTVVPSLHEICEQLGVAPDSWEDPVEGFVDAVRTVAGSRHLVVLVDDLHHAGPTTLHALFAASRLDGVSLVCTLDRAALDASRREDVGDAAVVQLEPLHPAEVAALVEQAYPRIGSDESMLSWLVEMSGGNPLLVQALCEELSRDEGHRDGDHRRQRAVGSLQAIVREWLTVVGVEGRHAAEVVAVAGTNATREIVERLVPPHGLHACVRSALVVEDHGGSFRFAHGAFAHLVYEYIPSGRRAEIHHRVARLLADEASVDIAFHLLRSGGQDLGATFTAVQHAARSMCEQGAYRDAAQWYGALHELVSRHRPETDALVVQAAIRWGDALRLAGAHEHVDVLRRAVRLAIAVDDAELIAEAARAFVQLGGSSDLGSTNQEAIDATELALGRLDGEEWAVVAAAMCTALALFGDPQRVRRVFLAAEQRARSPQVRRAVLPATYLSLGHPADLDRREALTAELGGLAEDSGDPRTAFSAHHQGFSNALQRADGVGVRRSLEAMRLLVDRVGDIGRRWEYLYCAAAVAHLEGDLERAERSTEDAFQLFGAVAPARARAAQISQLLMIRTHQGRAHELAPVFQQLMEQQPAVAAWPALLAGTLADVEPERAAHLARQTLGDGPADFTWLPRTVTAARAVIAAPDDDLVRRYLEVLSPWRGLVAWQGTCAFGIVDTTLAALAERLGDESTAADRRRSAELLARRLAASVFM